MTEREKRTLRAQEFVLEGTDGRELAALRQDKEGRTVLQFAGTNGIPRLCLSTDPNGTSRIALSYAQGQGSIEIETNDQGVCPVSSMCPSAVLVHVTLPWAGNPGVC